ncbi:MAG: DUF6691 family protein [Roseiarcus sp.]
MRNLLCFAVGLAFGVGLCVSGMTEPDKVLGFLDLAGQWDPSLALVMGAAVAVGLIGFTVARGRAKDLLGGAMDLPRRRDIDAPLVAGSLMFGAGWGLAGICPGPGIVDVGFLDPRAAAFVAAMAAGMFAYKLTGVRLPAPGPIGQDA